MTWPPKGGDDGEQINDPTTSIQLKEEAPQNDEAFRPIGTYKAAPTIYAEQPAALSEDVWPPPEPTGRLMKMFGFVINFFEAIELAEIDDISFMNF